MSSTHCTSSTTGMQSIANILSSAFLLVCLSVSPFAYLKNHMSQFHLVFMYAVSGPEAQASSDDSAIYYVFPILWKYICQA